MDEISINVIAELDGEEIVLQGEEDEDDEELTAGGTYIVM